MLIPRVIPCLLFEDGAMVKTERFGKRTYLGDPINVVNLFNRFEVDEILLIDIGATRMRIPPNFDLIGDLSEECWVPLSYGGGIKDLRDIERIISSGVEKVCIGTSATDLGFIEAAAKEFGTQCIVASVDVRDRFWGQQAVYTRHGRQRLKGTAQQRAKRLADAGAGEIFLQSISLDGTMKGYDLDLISRVAEAVDIPVIACSGAANRADLPGPIQAGAAAVAAGSLFVFSGIERGVLINFPERSELENLMRTNV